MCYAYRCLLQYTHTMNVTFKLTLMLLQARELLSSERGPNLISKNKIGASLPTQYN